MHKIRGDLLKQRRRSIGHKTDKKPNKEKSDQATSNTG